MPSKYIDHIKKKTNGRLIYFTVDLHYLRERRNFVYDDDPKHLFASQWLKNLELQIFSKSDIVLTPSNYEEQIIRESLPNKKVFTIPLHLYDFSLEENKTVVKFADREGILFLGGFGHPPNEDAVLWFVEEILPRVKQHLPEITFTVAGSKPTEKILALEKKDLQVTGYVADLVPLFAKSRVFVAPLRYGAGVKGKIVTSMLEGVPVVTTSIGNEGLNLANGQEALIADDPAAFASHIVELYTNQNLWDELSRHGQAYVHRHFSSEKAQRLMEDIFGIIIRQCSVCGNWVNYVPPATIDNLREARVCEACGATYRVVHLASTILELLGLGQYSSLKESLGELTKKHIYEIGCTGAINQLLAATRNFVFSDFFDDTPPGFRNASGILCEDVQKLSFDDGSFDLIISQDVLEHIPDPFRGLSEIYRVLKPNGYHIFTVPFHADMARSVSRVRLESGILHHILPPVYHGDPVREKGSLVCTDFGQDFLNLLQEIGFEVSSREISHEQFPNGGNIVFITRKK